jgi:D-3-phosphoglycerate dehydrogenase
MGKPAVLLIGAITHVKKEWEECGAFAVLKV